MFYEMAKNQKKLPDWSDKNAEKLEKERRVFLSKEDLKLRGFGDLIGFQQSGIKNFKYADPVVHKDLFILAENYVKNITEEINHKKFTFLLKLFDKAEIINIKDV